MKVATNFRFNAGVPMRFPIILTPNVSVNSGATSKNEEDFQGNDAAGNGDGQENTEFVPLAWADRVTPGVGVPECRGVRMVAKKSDHWRSAAIRCRTTARCFPSSAPHDKLPTWPTRSAHFNPARKKSCRWPFRSAKTSFKPGTTDRPRWPTRRRREYRAGGFGSAMATRTETAKNRLDSHGASAVSRRW